ncbi:ATP-binding protein [Bacteriovoracales bacterium]|nr:ATP-binding protein [Bacteriovoracales bacterium]
MEKNSADLLQFLYLTPLGIIKTNNAGEILLSNPLACSYLLTIDSSKPQENLYDIFEGQAKHLIKKVTHSTINEGVIYENTRASFSPKKSKITLHYNFSVRKVKQDAYMWIIQDITELVRLEEQEKKSIQEQAIRQGKIEMLEGILHDVGNAHTSLSLGLENIKSSFSKEEARGVKNLVDLFIKNRANIETVFQEKTEPLFNFLEDLKNSFTSRENFINDKANNLIFVLKGIESILKIHKVGSKKAVLSSNIVSLINDCLILTKNRQDQQNIQIDLEYPESFPTLHFDRTKILQVFLNILNNAYDSLFSVKKEKKFIKIKAEIFENEISLIFEDNGIGFPTDNPPNLLEKNKSQKDGHMGYGLYHCQKIIDTHDGQLSIKSSGREKGATVEIKLPIKKEEK